MLCPSFDGWEVHAHTFERGESVCRWGTDHWSCGAEKNSRKTPRLNQDFRVWGQACLLLCFYGKDGGKHDQNIIVFLPYLVCSKSHFSRRGSTFSEEPNISDFPTAICSGDNRQLCYPIIAGWIKDKMCMVEYLLKKYFWSKHL